MILNIPPEPREIKQLIISVRGKLGNDNSIDFDALTVWFANKIPGYLWQKWKKELLKNGITWQKFLKIMKLHTNDMILWALQDKISWDELINRITATLSRYSNNI